MEKNELGLGVSQEETDAEPVEVKQIVRSQTDFTQQKKYDIRIEMSEGDPAKDWKCGVNGSVFQIWRGTIVTVPECVVGILRTSVASRLIQIPQVDGPPKNEWQEQSAVNYSIIRGPY
jgi:hypothetical protein